MNSMDQAKENFNVNQLHEQVKQLTAHVEASVHQGTAVHEVEQAVWSRVLAMGRQAMGLFFGLSGDGDQGEEVELPGGRVVRRLAEPHSRPYQSVFGCFELERAVYGTREAQKLEHVPLDSRLRLPASKFSYLLQEWDQWMVVEGPYAKVSDTLERILGFAQSVDSLERTNRQMAGSVRAFWATEEVVPPAAEEGAILVASADGKGVSIRGAAEEATLQAPPSAGGPKPGRKKMALLGAAYSVDPFVRTPEQVLEALFRDSPRQDDDPARPRPEPRHKRVRASLLRDGAGTMLPSFDELFGWLGHEASTRNPAADKDLVVLMDGDEALWNAALKAIPEGSGHVVEILDLLHVSSHVWDAAKLFHPVASPAAQLFVRTQMGRILSGEVQRVIRGLRWRGTHQGLGTRQLEKLERVCGYFQGNAHRMAYDQYLAKGYPIATGVIEGACRHVVKDRMERSGMRWVLNGADAMLGLRCVHISGLWKQFIEFHIARQCQRLYPHGAANDDAWVVPIAA